MTLGVPITVQETKDSCGPATLLAVLRYWLGDEAPAEEEDLYDALAFDPKVGAEPRAMARVARAFGLDAEVVAGATRDRVATRVAAGEAAILQLQAWAKDDVDYDEDWDDGHYVVVLGSTPKGFVVMDPLTPATYRSLPFGELGDRWHGWDGDKKVRGLAVFVGSDGEPKGEELGAEVGGPLP